MASYFPPVGFHFLVKFEGIDNKEHDGKFQSVAGLSVDLETEEYAEGGENRFKHKFPVKTKFPNLVLQRGFLTDSAVLKWCKDAIEDFVFKPINLTVMLLDHETNPLCSWNIVNAYPVKWSISDLNALESKAVIESFELAYNYFTIKKD